MSVVFNEKQAAAYIAMISSVEQHERIVNVENSLYKNRKSQQNLRDPPKKSVHEYKSIV